MEKKITCLNGGSIPPGYAWLYRSLSGYTGPNPPDDYAIDLPDTPSEITEPPTKKRRIAIAMSKLGGDLDEDHEMTSSSSGDTFDDDGLFPDSSHDFPRAETPQNDHLNASAPGELSPPRSQANTQSQGAFAEPTLSNMNGQANSDYENTAPQGAKDSEWKPGAWKTKRAQEEYARAMEHMVDKDFSLKEFGDVMAPGGFNPKAFSQVLAKQGFDPAVFRDVMNSVPGRSVPQKEDTAPEEKPRSG